MKLQISELSHWIERSNLTPTECVILGQAPLASRLFDVYHEDRTSFHMPGHVSGRAFSEALAGLFMRADTTELPITDDLNDPQVTLNETETRIAKVYHAAHTFLLTGGSTEGLKAALLTVVGKGGRIAAPAISHRAVLHASALFDFEWMWIEGDAAQISERTNERLRYSLFQPSSVNDLKSCLSAAEQRGQLPDAVCIMSPDYYGYLMPISEWAEICHGYGIPLIVDEAHGALFAFGSSSGMRQGESDLPISALEQGADLVIHSAHKTLPALTPTALLHVSHHAKQMYGEAIVQQIKRTLIMLRTSSPSLIQAASIDWAVALLEQDGRERIQTVLSYLSTARQQIQAIEGLQCELHPDPAYMDPLRLVISTANVCSARWLYHQLQGKGIDLEFSDLTRLVCIVTPYHEWQDFERLILALQDILACLKSGGYGASIHHRMHVSPIDLKTLQALDQAWQQQYVKRHAPLQLKSFMPSLTDVEIDLNDEIHLIAGNMLKRAITPYPPGVPLFYPGDILTQQDVQLVRQLRTADVSFATD